MITNEQKAKEIAGYKPDDKPEIPMFEGQDGDKYACYESAMAMAKWKDEHYKLLLDAKDKEITKLKKQNKFLKQELRDLSEEFNEDFCNF